MAIEDPTIPADSDPEVEATIKAEEATQTGPIENTSSTVDDGSDPYVYQGESTIPPPQEQQNIDDGSDPYVYQGQSTIPPAEQPVVDDGSDPYVSNGQSTIPPPQEQPNADDGSDPYVYQGQSTIPPILNTQANQSRSLFGQKKSAQEGAIAQSQNNLSNPSDWRVRISIAKGLTALYNDTDSANILAPLAVTDGVVFPYIPQVQISHSANYDAFEPTHSNYKIYQYRSSSVGEVTLTADFTAQDTAEANYLLAVMHFFKSATKMFYGQDSAKGGPKNGTPPPICYLHGFGKYQFDGKPMVISNFSMTFPNDVDYIRAGVPSSVGGQNVGMFTKGNAIDRYIPGLSRLFGAGLSKTGELPAFKTQKVSDPTYVPTKVQLSVTCLPIVTRRDVSNKFSLRDYASGKLVTKLGGGFW